MISIVDSDSSNKVVIITGASGGIGNNLVNIFASNKYNVIACGRKFDSSLIDNHKKIENSYKVSIHRKIFDLTDNEQVRQVSGQINSEYRGIDILVNCSGVATGSTFQMTSINNLEKIIKNNLLGPMLFSQYIAKIMIGSRSGTIVNISSKISIEPMRGTLEYGLSKAAINYLTKIMDIELSQYGINTFAVAPGLVNTGMHFEMDSNVRNKILEQSPTKTAADPKDLAFFIYTMSTKFASEVSGEILPFNLGTNSDN
jgi:short-subunit dehydrogenase